MGELHIEKFNVTGPVLVRPERYGDDRGYFTETWNRKDWTEADLPAFDWVQDNEAYSKAVGTLRGLHFQAPPFAQAKLIRVISGAIFDVAVDIRRGSPTFGKTVAVTLNENSGEQLLVPRGFAHGYQTLEPDTLIAYKCDNTYCASAEDGLLWSCTELSIDWPHPADVTMSGRDFTWSGLSEFSSPFEYHA